ncbi:MAG: peptidoglycan editing factor PgeF [Phascolarctobacterium sp.]|nr:peptidoglycan editing factor PgeF [Phascolarctobacterium sp.]
MFTINHKNNIWYGTFPVLERAGFVHGCSCRLHGESDVVAGTLNLALHVGDDVEKVLRNRRAFAEAIGVDANRFTTCQQVHGSKVVQVTEELVGSGAKDFANTIADTDALVTNLPDVPLMLFYADCVPVLLADLETGAIGLAHAGWRGTVANIGVKTLAAMGEAFGTKPENVLAAIGPSIGACCYEVDDFVRDQASGYEKYFAPKGGGKYQLDLWGMNAKQLQEAGVPEGNITVAGVCTNDNVELFCSYRAEQGKTGRMGVCLCAKK